KRVLEHQRLSGLFRWKIGERDFGETTFFRSKAGPESRVDDGRDRVCVRLGREAVLAHSSCFCEVASEMFFNKWRCYARSLVSWGHAHRFYLPVKSVFSSTKQSPLPHGSCA